MPSSLPVSTTGVGVGPFPADGNDLQDPTSVAAAAKPRYVVSASGHAAHPEDIIASCRALQAHVAKLQADAEADLRALDESIRARELAEKRRVAPGWLDSDARLLEPERKSTASPGLGGELAGGGEGEMLQARMSGLRFGEEAPGVSEMAVPDEGEELDRAFGVLALGRS